jgi:hypothetical protein
MYCTKQVTSLSIQFFLVTTCCVRLFLEKLTKFIISFRCPYLILAWLFSVILMSVLFKMFLSCLILQCKKMLVTSRLGMGKPLAFFTLYSHSGPVVFFSFICYLCLETEPCLLSCPFNVHLA